MKRHLMNFLPVVALVMMLGACASTGDDDAVAVKAAPTFGCPRAGLMPAADRLAVFEDMANPSRETATVKAQLYGMTYECKPVPSRGEIEVALTARFVADRMPLAGSLKGLTLPYFIAVLDAEDNILMHRRFDVRLVFGEGGKNIAKTQARAEAEHIIPVGAPDAMAAGNYKIVAGFELIPAQIRYNKGEFVLTDTPAPAADTDSKPARRTKHKGTQ